MEIAASILGTAAGAVLAFVVDSLIQRLSTRTKSTLDKEEIDLATSVIREELAPGGDASPPQGGAGPSTSTPAPTPAELEAMGIMRVYGKDLMTEANRIAKRARAERPSKAHVRQAADRIGVLRDRAGVASDLALAVGAILIGAAASYQINLWTGGRAQDGMGPWMALILAVGVGLTVAAALLKWRKS